MYSKRLIIHLVVFHEWLNSLYWLLQILNIINLIDDYCMLLIIVVSIKVLKYLPLIKVCYNNNIITYKLYISLWFARVIGETIFLSKYENIKCVCFFL